MSFSKIFEIADRALADLYSFFKSVIFLENRCYVGKFHFIFILLKNYLLLTHDFNHFHNILRLFDVLPNFPFNASEMKRDY